MTMTHRERAIAALECRVPDRIPHFEIEYQISDEMFGKHMITESELRGLTQSEIDRKIEEYANVLAEVFTELD